MTNNFNSVREYKQYFDQNFFKGNKCQTALFINFLMQKKVKNNEIYTLTGVKRSQITNYKKVMKEKKINELKTKTFREIFKDIKGGSGSEDESSVPARDDAKPRASYKQEDLISAIENIDLNDYDDFDNMSVDEDFIQEMDALDEVADRVNSNNRYNQNDEPVPERSVNIDGKSFSSVLSLGMLRKYYEEIDYYEQRVKDLETASGIKNIEDIVIENEELKERIKELEEENKRLKKQGQVNIF